MDGRELTFFVKQSTGEFLVKFCYPMTRKMMIETSNKCKNASDLINKLTVHHFLPDADNTETHNTSVNHIPSYDDFVETDQEGINIIYLFN